MLVFHSIASGTWPGLLAELAFVGLLSAAAIFDLRHLRIPNLIPLLLTAAYPLAAFAGAIPPNWPFHLVGAGLVLTVGVLLFSRGLLGGGDVKLLAAATLWYGTDRLPVFLFGVSVAGGLLAIAVLAIRLVSRFRPLPVSRAPRNTSLHRIELPYGVAIALGGVLVSPLFGP